MVGSRGAITVPFPVCFQPVIARYSISSGIIAQPKVAANPLQPRVGESAEVALYLGRC